MMKRYKLPTIAGVSEHSFLLTGEKDYQRILSTVRKMNLSEVEEIITELIYGQLTEKIVLSLKEESEEP